jgi:hypothetical protein
METKPPPQRSYMGAWLFIGFVLLTVTVLTPLMTHLGRQTAKSAQARQEAAELRAALIRYQRTYGETPGNSKAKILFSSLAGMNPKGIIFFQAPYSRFSPEGELVDPWRSPYHIDLKDPYDPRVHSFGPNLRDDHGAESSDDIVTWRK